MIVKRCALILCLLFNSALAGSSQSDCKDSLRELFRSSPVAQEKLRQFLKLQAGITLHKLAYASVRSSGMPEEFRLESEILRLLNEVREKNAQDPEFEKVHRLFHDPNNKVSRSALSKALPYIADILNEQQREQSEFERMAFNLGQADIKTLAILAEREAYANGRYASALWKDVSDDKSILNFAKIINSSVRTSGGPSEEMLARMDKRISELNARAIELLSELDLSDACKRAIAACVVEGDRGKVIQSELSSFLTEIVGQVELADKHKHLRYDDVWLHTGRRRARTPENPINPGQVEPQEKRQAGPRVYHAPEKDPDEIIHDHLIEKVLSYMPQLFTREDLENNRELALALARAIDEGVLGKKGEERVFVYQGDRYLLPELWNSETRDTGDGKLEWAWGKLLSAGDKVEKWWGVARTRRFFQNIGQDIMEYNGVDAQEHFPHISEEDMPDFLTTWNKQKNAFGHKFSFVFEDKLYDIKTGKEIPKNADYFLSTYRSGKASDDELPSASPFDLKAEDKVLVVREIEAGAQSYISGDEARHISGAPVEFEREYARAKREYVEASGGGVREAFPTEEEVREIAGSSEAVEALTLKTLADRKRAFFDGSSAFDLHRGKLNRRTALQEVLDNRRRQGLDRSHADYSGISDGHLAANAVALLNDEALFARDGRQFYAETGRAVASRRGDNAREGFYNFDQRQLELERINAGDDISVLLDFQKRYPNQECPAFTVLDKKKARLRVFEVADNVTKILWEAEVLAGSSPGDQRTIHSGGVSGPVSNNSTAAGIFTVGKTTGSNPEFLALHNGAEIAASLSAAGPEKATLLEDGDISNNRSTNGGVMLSESDLKEYEKYKKEGCPFYILPETDEVEFNIRSERLALEVADPGKDGDFQVAAPVNESPRSIKLSVFDEVELNETSKEFLKALEENKEKIMEDLGITNAEYNQLAKTAFGILGVESQFGEGLKLFPRGFKWSDLGNLANPRRHKETAYGGAVVFMGKLLNRGEFSTDPDDRSRGLTQIKAVEDYPLIKNFGGINRDNLMEPDKAAVATVYVLGEMLERLKRMETNHTNISDKNRMEYLYYIYNGQTGQIANSSATPELNERARKVSAYAEMLTVYSR